MRERRWRPVSPSWHVQGPIATEPPTTFAYDTNGNLITTTDPLGNATQRAYDQVSRLVNLTDPRQLQTQFRYDGLNRVTEIADARQGITRFGYDGNGNLLSVKDAKNQPTSYTYDSMDRLFTRKDALNRIESYQYDPVGNLSQFTDRKNQQATFQYDALNRRTRADYADGSFTTFTYDAIGKLTRATDSTSGAIDFFYDTLDRLILEVTPLGAVAYEYDAIGRRTKMTVAGQAPVTYQYDAASRLTQVAQGSLIVGMGYDAAGRRTSLTYPNGTSTTYTYDNASRLTSITHNGSSGTIEALTYVYDAAGNRTSLTRTNGTASLLPTAIASATYDTANEQTQFAGSTLTYDQNGNQTNDGTNTYTWDARNRLTNISGGVTASFSYDVLGRRVSKTISGETTQFLYSANDIVSDIGGGSVGATYLRSLNVDEPFVRQSSVNEFFHTDVLGSTLALSNMAGAVATSYNYEAFGKTMIIGTSTNLFEYTGRENDGTGLYYYRARYYTAKGNRFTQEDPIRFGGQSFNVYTYVRNNPLGFRDPTGLIQCPCGLYATAVARVGGGNAEKAYRLRTEALAVAKSTGLPDPTDGPQDAFRHCYWSCRMTQDLGPDAATKIGYLYEECRSDPTRPGSTVMDLVNNLVGRSVGQPGADCRTICFDNTRNGILQTGPGGSIPPNVFPQY
jgi:RHS repeat-associated protein